MAFSILLGIRGMICSAYPSFYIFQEIIKEEKALRHHLQLITVILYYIIIIADVMKMENRGFQKTQETKVPILKCSPTHQQRRETLCPGMHLAQSSENNLCLCSYPIIKVLSSSSFSSPKGGGRKKFPTLLSPLLSPTTSTGGTSPGASTSSGAGQYSSTSRLNEGQQSTLSPSLNRKGQKLSRSSEDLVNPKEVTAGLRNVASKFLGVVELDTVTGDLHVRGGSLQKDLDVASHVLEEGAVETAAIIEKGVLNPFSKLTKGLGAVLKGQSEITTNVISDQDLDISPTRSASASQNNQVANQLLKAKIDQAKSQTQVFLL